MKRFLALPVAILLVIGLAIPALACSPKPVYDVSASMVLCGAPRLVTTLINDGNLPVDFTQMFTNADGVKKFIGIVVPAETTKTLTRWVKGGTMAKVWGGKDELLARLYIGPINHSGPCIRS